MTPRWRIALPLAFALALSVLAQALPKSGPAHAAPPAQGQSQASLTFSLAPETPFFSQTALQGETGGDGLPYRLGNSTLPLWDQGCAVASLAMVYRRHGVDTDVVRLNDALVESGGFSGALLNWSDAEAVTEAGAPWIRGVERINTTRPADYQERIDASLARGEPVIAFLNRQHYVVLTGREESGGKVSYRINDPWALTAQEGQGIALEDNLLGQGGFAGIRQLVFVTAEEYAPTNGILVDEALSPAYVAWLGSAGSLGNPVAAAEGMPGKQGVWQRFEHGAIFGQKGRDAAAIFGPVWEKYQSGGGLSRFGAPTSSIHSYLTGQAVTWRADFAEAGIVWEEGEKPDKARVLTADNAFLSEYYANPDLAGAPVYRRYEVEPLFEWGDGAPGPWVQAEGFSARFTGAFDVGGFGWRYNFTAAGDSGVRLLVDGDVALDNWDSPADKAQVTRNAGAGRHTLTLEYRHLQGDAWLKFAYAAWPATTVFAAEDTISPADRVPVSVAQNLPDLGTPIAQATGTARAVIATMTAEARLTPTPDSSLAALALEGFEEWAAANGEPYRDAQATVLDNDGFFAAVRLTAWFRPSHSAPWEEREALVECRQVGGVWQCDDWLDFALSEGERSRRAQATATAQAAVQATAEARWGELGAMVLIPAGEFQMGSTDAELERFCEQLLAAGFDDECDLAWFSDEQPQHTVYLDDYFIDKYEVTNVRYQACVEAGACTEPHDLNSYTRESYYGNPEFAAYPAINVDWFQAEAFCAWEGKRLPTEAEWEKAARGTDARLYPWGNAAPTCELVNSIVLEDGEWRECVGDTSAVGSYPAGESPYGVMDMSGNVWEWVNDWYDSGYYSVSPGSNPPGPAENEYGPRVLRGGSWFATSAGPCAPPTATTTIRTSGATTAASVVSARSDAGLLVSGFLGFWNGGVGASPHIQFPPQAGRFWNVAWAGHHWERRHPAGL